MARLQIRQRDQSSPAQDLDYSHIPYSSPTKRSRTVKAKLTIWVSNGNRFIQGVSTRLSVPCGQLGLLERPVWADDSGLEEKTESAEPAAVAEAFIPQPSLHHCKRAAQTNRWLTEVIPKLVSPYMGLLRETNNLCNDANPVPLGCTCTVPAHLLSVIVVRFQSK